MNIQDCVDQGLLRKTTLDISKSKKAILSAIHKFRIAKASFDAGIYENAFIDAYTAMFHAARALLFKDGYSERSHFAVYVYLKEKYSTKIAPRYLTELNSLRSIRHNVMYGNEEDGSIREVMESEASSALQLATGFLAVVQKLVSEV